MKQLLHPLSHHPFTSHFYTFGGAASASKLNVWLILTINHAMHCKNFDTTCKTKLRRLWLTNQIEVLLKSNVVVIVVRLESDYKNHFLIKIGQLLIYLSTTGRFMLNSSSSTLVDHFWEILTKMGPFNQCCCDNLIAFQ